MLVVETIAKIRRLFFHHKKPIKAISRELKVSRRVVRKAIRSETTEFRYERSVQPMPKLGAWREQLDGLLAANEGKPARERLTLMRVFETLRDLGFDGGYDAVRRYAKSWRKARGTTAAQAYIPLSFAPGEAYQFDWSYEVVLIEGVTVKVKVAHLRLCHSRMLFVRAYPRESQEMVFDAHDRAFAFFKGACTRGIYDNMKTAVETVFLGKERQRSADGGDPGRRAGGRACRRGGRLRRGAEPGCPLRQRHPEHPGAEEGSRTGSDDHDAGGIASAACAGCRLRATTV
jgi:transposase